MAAKNKGIARAEEVYLDRSQRPKEIKTEGKKIMGYICLYPPLEMLDALDIVPYRIYGDTREPITDAEKVLTPVTCPFIRSYVDLGLKRKYDFLDGVIGVHACDVAGMMAAHLWKEYIRPPGPDGVYYIDVPHTDHAGSQEYLKKQLEDMKTVFLEPFGEREMSLEKLKECIKGRNRQRALVRELYELRKPDPPLISGSETLQVIIALTSIPLDEGNELLRQVIDEVKQRKNGPPKQPARLLIWGSIIDDIALIAAIESMGANVVIDDICVGTRAYSTDVEVTDDPLSALAHHYLVNIKCPRTYRQPVYVETEKEPVADLEHRFGYLKDYAREWNVNGAILQAVRYCDTHAYEVPQLGDYFTSLGIPNIYLEHEYAEASLAPLETRVEAFLEMLEDRD